MAGGICDTNAASTDGGRARLGDIKVLNRMDQQNRLTNTGTKILPRDLDDWLAAATVVIGGSDQKNSSFPMESATPQGGQPAAAATGPFSKGDQAGQEQEQ